VNQAKEPRVTARPHLLVERLRALLWRPQSPPSHLHRLDLPLALVPGEPLPTGRCTCGAIGLLLRDVVGPEWAWLGVVAPELAGRVVWLSSGQYAAALHEVPLPQAEGEEAELGEPDGLHER
jgi:hypothetical protein